MAVCAPILGWGRMATHLNGRFLPKHSGRSHHWPHAQSPRSGFPRNAFPLSLRWSSLRRPQHQQPDCQWLHSEWGPNWLLPMRGGLRDWALQLLGHQRRQHNDGGAAQRLPVVRTSVRHDLQVAWRRNPSESCPCLIWGHACACRTASLNKPSQVEISQLTEKRERCVL